MINRLLYIIALVVLFGQANAQFWVQSADESKPYPIGLKIDLLAKEADPGVRAAVEFPLINKLFRIIGNSNNKHEINKQTLFVPSFSWFTKPSKQHAFLLEGELINRRKNDRGFFTEIGLGVGAAYINGKYIEKNLLSNAVPAGLFVIPSLSLGIGTDLFLVTDGRYKYLWNIRLHVPLLFPVNKSVFPLYMIQGGFSFYFPKNWRLMKKQQYSIMSRTRR